jgi:hypothetical protein
MNPRFGNLLILTGLLALPSVALGQQLCLSESQSPSTTPTSRFTDHGDGTVTDTETGLMWAKCQQNMSGSDCSVWTGQQYPKWGAALLSAEESTLAGYTDWRLPNIKELDTIIEQRCANPAINLAVFPNTPNTEFWSSSPSVLSTGSSWTVQFLTGDSQSVYGRNELHAVRLVRDGS